MTKEEYKYRLNLILDNNKRSIRELKLKYAISNSKYLVGSMISGYIIKEIDAIDYNGDVICVYFCAHKDTGELKTIRQTEIDNV